MSGRRPAPGNRSGGSRLAATVSRQLRGHGFILRAGSDFGRREGVFARNSGEGRVCLTVDIDPPSERRYVVAKLAAALRALGYVTQTAGEGLVYAIRPEAVRVAESAVQRYVEQGYERTQAVQLAVWEEEK